MPRVAIVAAAALNQWALDFEGNYARIEESCRRARAAGATLRVGPELEATGYGAYDHHLELDTAQHAWELVARLLAAGATDGLLVDLGMPVRHNAVNYNCRVFLCNGRVVLIRPKTSLADDGNYREPRWFTAWPAGRGALAHYRLPAVVAAAARGGQRKAPFGVASIQTNDTLLAAEICEELFTPRAPNIDLGLTGVEIINNGSASHHELRKLSRRVDLMREATARGGGVYVYANQVGCDGDRLYFDGSAMVIVNGTVRAQTPQFSLKEVDLAVAAVDLDEVASLRGASASRGVQAAETEPFPVVEVDFDLCAPEGARVAVTPAREPTYLSPAEEIANGPASWLWDYLRRSGMGGFFLPLSGGLDSGATAAIVAHMCKLVFDEIEADNSATLRDLRRVVGDEFFRPQSPKEIAGRIFHTAFLASEHSSEKTAELAEALAGEIGAQHHQTGIGGITDALVQSFVGATNQPRGAPLFKSQGGSARESVALQNIQARSRMVLSYMLAQLVGPERAPLLVLSSANVDEALFGYLTKYDCSSGDLNPIGGIAKADLRLFAAWAAEHDALPALRDILGEKPKAELEPLSDNQTDEDDMGMTYDELSVIGRLRKTERLGPLLMFKRLCAEWPERKPEHVAHKTKHFFRSYARNRHKLTVLTPSYHAESYSPDDNRFDMRPFLYPTGFDAQFAAIDASVEMMGKVAPQ